VGRCTPAKRPPWGKTRKKKGLEKRKSTKKERNVEKRGKKKVGKISGPRKLANAPKRTCAPKNPVY